MSAQQQAGPLTRWGIQPKPENIPQSLKDEYSWVAWEAVRIPGKDKYSKIPVNPLTGGRASSTNPAHWGTFEQAMARYEQGTSRGECSGVGLILTGQNLDVGDLDRQLGRDEGDVVALATAAVTRAYGAPADTYTELSPSGRGIRVVSLRKGERVPSFSNHTEGVDLYTGEGGRFVTITGEVVNAAPLKHVNLSGVERFRPAGATGEAAGALAGIPALLDPDDVKIPSSLSEGAVQWLLTGEHIGKSDGNGSALSCAISLYKAGLSDAEVLTLLSSSVGGEEVAGAPHRREGSPEGQQQWLWAYVCRKARAHSPANALEALPDLSAPPEGVFKALPEDAPAALASPEGFATVEDLIGSVRPTKWMIKGVVEAEKLGILYGETGSRKSFVAIDMMMSIASGRRWQGAKTKRGICIYLASEGSSGIAKRVAAWQRHNQVVPGAAAFYSRIMQSDISTAEGVKEIAEGIVACHAHAMKVHGALPIAMVCIDTLSASSGGMDESDNSVVAGAMQRLVNIRDTYNCGVMVVHHTGHSAKTRERGASSLRSNADYSIFCDLEGSEEETPLNRPTRVISQKSKDDEAFASISLTATKFFFDDMVDEDGERLSSLVLSDEALFAKIAADDII